MEQSEAARYLPVETATQNNNNAKATWYPGTTKKYWPEPGAPTQAIDPIAGVWTKVAYLRVGAL